MFDYITGKLVSANPQKAIIDVSGLGYLIFITIATFEKLPQLGSEVKLFISAVIREDSHKLYGFLTREERDFFESLNEISGIGPRLSVALLGHMSLGDLHSAVENGNAQAIAQTPGIGKKMAEKLILELRDKFAKFGKEAPTAQMGEVSSLSSDAISALINLGFAPLEAQKAVKKSLDRSEEEPPLSALIANVLKNR